jgi:hypothetical protein
LGSDLGRRLVSILEAQGPPLRDTAFDAACAGSSSRERAAAREVLRAHHEACDDLFRRVRAMLFEAALGDVDGDAAALRRRAFAQLGDQVRASVRESPGNRWLFEPWSPGSDAIRVAEPVGAPGSTLVEHTPVRIDLSHSGWSDIFFLAMDEPAAARVINVSVDLGVDGGPPAPPIETRFSVIDRPVVRLLSEDLGAEAELVDVADVFAFDADDLGLLRAGVVASGIVPPGAEAAGGSLAPLLASRVGPGRGIEIATRVAGIPRGSRLGVSTMLLASLVSVCMRATGQTRRVTGTLEEDERRLVASRCVLGEWLGGSGGGWQDSGALWPGAKRIEGVVAAPGDPEYGTSRGCLLPAHTPLPLSDALREGIAGSLLLVHGGLAADVGPILERVTEGYLLRDEPAWSARREARRLYDEILAAWHAGDVAALAAATDRNFHGPLRTILPEASNPFTERVIARLAERLGAGMRGFWMLGGASGAGMGFWVAPERRDEARDALSEVLAGTAAELADSLPFASEPFLYEFSINDVGTRAAFRGPPSPKPSRPRRRRGGR